MSKTQFEILPNNLLIWSYSHILHLTLFPHPSLLNVWTNCFLQWQPLLTSLCRQEDIRPLLQKLHWLLVHSRIQYKISPLSQFFHWNLPSLSIWTFDSLLSIQTTLLHLGYENLQHSLKKKKSFSLENELFLSQTQNSGTYCHMIFAIHLPHLLLRKHWKLAYEEASLSPTCVFVHACVCLHLFVCMWVYVCIWMCMHVGVCVFVYKNCLFLCTVNVLPLMKYKISFQVNFSCELCLFNNVLVYAWCS